MFVPLLSELARWLRVLLAVCMLAGVMIGCAVSYVLHDLWRA